MKTGVALALLVVLSSCVSHWHGCEQRVDKVVLLGGDLGYECTIEPARNVNRCTIRDNRAGKVLCERDFRAQPSNRYLHQGDFGQLISFDGENIRMRTTDGREVTLSPLMPCKAED